MSIIYQKGDIFANLPRTDVQTSSGSITLYKTIVLCYDVDTSVPTATMTLKVNGTIEFMDTLSPENPSVQVNNNCPDGPGNCWDFTITLDAAKKQITWQGWVQYGSSGIGGGGVVFQW